MVNGLKKNKPKVLVAMSGGVDSSVAAALLKKAGFNLTGVFMKLWQGLVAGSFSGTNKNKNANKLFVNRCCSLEAEVRARKVASILKIPFYVFNFKKEFKEKIVVNFLQEYKKGITPNPCVACNKKIKFGLLPEKVLKIVGADFMATGHYVRLQVKTLNSKSKTLKLLKGKDKEKDQSYFLWQLSQKQLKSLLFPLGNYTKNQVRKLAEEFKLPVSKIPESQEICFIPGSINDFLEQHFKSAPGFIAERIGKKNKIIGNHKGLYFYTIGQRKGIKLAGGPYYVLDKILKKNLLIVTKNKKDLFKKELIVKKVNWISGKEPKLPLKLKVKIRYRQKAFFAVITKIQNAEYKVKFYLPQLAVTPGQSAVFYQNQELLGGGIIC